MIINKAKYCNTWAHFVNTWNRIAILTLSYSIRYWNLLLKSHLHWTNLIVTRQLKGQIGCIIIASMNEACIINSMDIGNWWPLGDKLGFKKSIFNSSFLNCKQFLWNISEMRKKSNIEFKVFWNKPIKIHSLYR